MIDRLEAEIAVLSAILLDNEQGGEAFDLLRAEDFAAETHRIVFAAMGHLAEHGKAVDPVTLQARLSDTGDLERVGGVGFFGLLMDAVPTAANVGFHAGLVRDAALRRALRHAAEQINALTESDVDPEGIVAGAEEAVLAAMDRYHPRSALPVKAVVWDVLEMIEERYRGDGRTIGIATGLTDVDQLLDGWHKGDLVIIAGRPSTGKTAFAMAAALEATQEPDVRGAFFSLEMSREQLIERGLAILSGVSLWDLRRGRLRNDDFPKIAAAAAQIGAINTQFILDDNPTQTVGGIRATARRLRRKYGRLDFIVVDYITLMDAPGRYDSRNEKIAAISKGLKTVAKDLDIAVICLSQLNRESERRGIDRPRLSDLRDSGAIEQDADVVMFLWGDPKYKDMVQPPLTLIVAKHRNGPTGDVRVSFDKKTGQFNNWSEREEM